MKTATMSELVEAVIEASKRIYMLQKRREIFDKKTRQLLKQLYYEIFPDGDDNYIEFQENKFDEMYGFGVEHIWYLGIYFHFFENKNAYQSYALNGYDITGNPGDPAPSVHFETERYDKDTIQNRYEYMKHIFEYVRENQEDLRKKLKGY
jgi:hypothetical protein